MTNSKSTKRALLSSAFAIMLCAAMLIGTTFAWFTDTASTGVNKIVSGKLNVALEMQDSTGKWVSAEGKTLNFIKAEGHETEEILWEPGCTYKLPELRIVNKGNLALKYNLIISGAAGDVMLLDALEFNAAMNGEVMPFVNGDTIVTDKPLYPGEVDGSSDILAISASMKKDADNKYQDKTLTGISVTVVATQFTYEHDSNDDQYDKDAEYPVAASREDLNNTITLDSLKNENGDISPVEVTLGNVEPENISYSENYSGYTGKGIMLGSTKLNRYGAKPAEIGTYKFTFKDGVIDSAANGYDSIDKYKDTSVYMLVPGNSDVTFENMTFNGVVSFDTQKYTSPWSNLNSLTFKNCTFNGIIIGTCPASNVTFDGCVFNAYTNAVSANNSNPIWWREDTEGSGDNANPIKTFTFINNKVTGTRPVKIERIGKTVSPIFTIKNNTFDISSQAGDTNTKNMAINIGMGENPNLPFTLIDDGNTISSNTASLYTASLTGGSNWYKEISGMRVLDGKGNNKVITAMVWKTTTGETFQLKTVD